MSPPTIAYPPATDLEDLLDNLSGSLESLYEMFRVSEENLVGCPNELFYAESLLNREIRKNALEMEVIQDWVLSVLRDISSLDYPDKKGK